MVKRIHAGNAAEAGMKAALLARKGFTGPREILEGDYGFCKVFTDRPEAIDWSKIVDDLGEKYVVEEVSVKPSPACGVLHSVVDCIKMIDAERRIEEDEVKEILVSGHENLVHVHNVYEPKSILSAQYSLPFTVGLAVEGRIDDMNVYLDESILANKKVLKCASKVKSRMDEEIQQAYPERFGGKVSIRFKDGQTIEKKVANPKGSYDNPFSQKELETKFKNMTEDSLGESKSNLLMNRINSIDSIENVSDLFKQIY